MPPKALPQQPQLAIIKYTGAPDDVPIDKWLRLFERKACNLDWTDDEKVNNLCDYVQGEAFRWYLSDIFEVCNTWQGVKDSMMVRFGAPVSDPFRSFIHHRQQQDQSVQDYYEQKKRLGELAGLEVSHLISGLTDGLLPGIERPLVGTIPKTPLEWLSAALKIESSLERKPSLTSRRPLQARRTQNNLAAGDAPSQGTSSTFPKSECRHCTNIGLNGQFHWQNVCPYRPNVSAIEEDQGNGEGGSR